VRIALDAQLTVGTATGIGEYVRGLADALRREGIDVRELREPKLDPWRFDRRVYWDQVLLPQRARAARADVLHCASGTIPLRPGMPVVVTVHDVAWLRVQSHTRPYARYYFGLFSLAQYARAERIAVDSEFSRNELLELLEGYEAARVSVVYPGVADDFCMLERRGGDGRTILVVGTVERRKNLETILRALAPIRSARLVCVGPPTAYQTECQTLASSLGIADRVEFRGYVERRELLDLYATCAGLALASRYEGFGYAAAQALCAGTPFAVSDQSSLPEIAGGDAPVVPVDDVAGWSVALIAMLRGDGDERAAAVRNRSIERFRWTASARRMRDAYAAAAAS
jgi:glycosyltransferase involved in cell wall biosynthesis